VLTPVFGAVAYAWYAGTAGNERIHSITTINSAGKITLSSSQRSFFFGARLGRQFMKIGRIEIISSYSRA
jgi:hypothetical protein